MLKWFFLWSWWEKFCWIGCSGRFWLYEWWFVSWLEFVGMCFWERVRERENWNVVWSCDWNLYCFRLKLLLVCFECLDVLIRCIFLLLKFSEFFGFLVCLFNLVWYFFFGFNGDCLVYNSCINFLGLWFYRLGVLFLLWYLKILYNWVLKIFLCYDFLLDLFKFDDNKVFLEDLSNVCWWGWGNYFVFCFVN